MRPITFLLAAMLNVALAFAIALVSASVCADPPRSESVQCTAIALASHPSFTQVSPGRAEYDFSGLCETRDSRFFTYRLAGTWTPSETNSANANASEAYRIDMSSGPAATFIVVIGWHCDIDPWLHDVGCVRIGDNLSDESRALWRELGEGSWPSSRRGIPRSQRASLLAEYNRANGVVDRPDSPITRVRTDGAGSYGAAQTRDVRSVARPVSESALNPQSLPAKPAGSGLTQPTSRAAKTGIIIVSGRPQSQRVVKKKAGPAIDAHTVPATDPPTH